APASCDGSRSSAARKPGEPGDPTKGPASIAPALVLGRRPVDIGPSSGQYGGPPRDAPLTPPPAYSADERRLTLISVLVVFLLSAMSQTVVATAMPRIVAELSGLHLYAWAVTAYLLVSTVCVPIWGKLGDIWGRK